MGLDILLIIGVSALICVLVKWLFPRRGAWLPVFVSVVLPPFLFVPFRFVLMLADIGASTPDGASAPPGTVDKFADGLSSLLTFAALWLVIGGVTAFIVLRFHKYFVRRP